MGLCAQTIHRYKRVLHCQGLGVITCCLFSRVNAFFFFFFFFFCCLWQAIFHQIKCCRKVMKSRGLSSKIPMLCPSSLTHWYVWKQETQSFSSFGSIFTVSIALVCVLVVDISAFRAVTVLVVVLHVQAHLFTSQTVLPSRDSSSLV